MNMPIIAMTNTVVMEVITDGKIGCDNTVDIGVMVIKIHTDGM